MFSILIYNIFDPILVTYAVITIIIFFSVSSGYFGKSLQQLEKKFFNPVCFEFNLTIIIIFILLVFLFYLNSEIVCCIHEETRKQLVNVKGNDINVHNHNINIPESLAKAVTAVGIEGAIAGGMTAASHFF